MPDNHAINRSRGSRAIWQWTINSRDSVIAAVPRLMLQSRFMTNPNSEESTSYTPLGERINQDVIHDNFVPKYSALATAPRTKLVLIGVWLIFLPMSFGVFALPIYFLTGHDAPFASILQGLMLTAFGILAIMILYSQTRRYLKNDYED